MRHDTTGSPRPVAPRLLGAALLVALGAAAACDGGNLFESGGKGTDEPGTDSGAPSVEILDPPANATVPQEDSVWVRVQLADDGGVKTVKLEGVAFLGDPDLGTDEVVACFQAKSDEFEEAVGDTIWQRYLLPVASAACKEVSLIATAEDAAGNITADTLPIALGGPRVALENPATGTILQAGQDVGIQVRAEDPKGKISRLELTYSGVTSGKIVWDYASTLPGSVAPDTLITLPAGQAGTLVLSASATSGIGITSQPDTAHFQVIPVTVAGDTVAPSAAITLAVAGRVEAADSVRLTVSADDRGGTGVRRVGATVVAVNGTVPTDTVMVFSMEKSFPAPRTGRVSEALGFPASRLVVDPLALPDTIRVFVHAYAVDDAQRCGASVSTDLQRLDCAPLGASTVAAGAVGQSASTVIVRGQTVLLPQGGVIADAAVDVARQRLFLSNFTRSHIDMLDLQAMRFSASPILAGSQPWGLFIDNDSLIVANSGGTNISFVGLNAAAPTEHLARRLPTPNAVLWDVREQMSPTDGVSWETRLYDFSDRPQFIARDSEDNLLYSTVPTEAATPGTIRIVEPDPDPARTGDIPESRILYASSVALTDMEDNYAIAHVDSVAAAIVYVDSVAYGGIGVYDHQSGFPDSVVVGVGLSVVEALGALEQTGKSDVVYHIDKAWSIPDLALSDTTFVAASGDQSRVAFGEGATAPYAQIFMWEAQSRSFSDAIEVTDLINNASERVTGIGLNRDGSLGVARGQESAYFFTPDLRLQGRFELETGGAGAVLHPDHDSLQELPPAGVAFVGTAGPKIQIIRTDHFKSVGEIEIRSRAVGPIKASGPLAGDNQGLTCPGNPACVVAKLYAVTEDGGVVIVDVRARDLQQ